VFNIDPWDCVNLIKLLKLAKEKVGDILLTSLDSLSLKTCTFES